jgi:GNAT superfamily N-acetyltransferase
VARPSPRVRDVEAADRPWVEGFLEEVCATRVARRGELVRPIDHPMLIATADGAPTGLLTYIISSDECEILTLHTVTPWQGTGTVLIDALRTVASTAGCRAIRVVTTNDNVDALRFYQRRGFRIQTIRPGAVDDARLRLKPEIPGTGDHGIPLRDEIELEHVITSD